MPSSRIAGPKAGISSNVALLRTLIVDPVKSALNIEHGYIKTGAITMAHHIRFVDGFIGCVKYYMDYRARHDLHGFGLADCARGVVVYSEQELSEVGVWGFLFLLYDMMIVGEALLRRVA